jgi:hypothetical protein
VLHTTFLGDQVNEDEMGRACGMYMDKRASHDVMIEALELIHIENPTRCHSVSKFYFILI